VLGHSTAPIVSVLALSLLLFGSAGGCGYRFVEYRSDGADRREIAVLTLENDSEEPGIELLASQALRHEILSRGALSLTGDPATADFTLRGRVLPIRTRSRSFTGVALAREFSVILRMELRVDAAKAGQGKVGRTKFEAADIYLASSDSAVLRKNRQEALRYLSGVLARRVHDAIDRDVLGVMQ
jgi:hypothetical protein